MGVGMGPDQRGQMDAGVRRAAPRNTTLSAATGSRLRAHMGPGWAPLHPRWNRAGGGRTRSSRGATSPGTKRLHKRSVTQLPRPLLLSQQSSLSAAAPPAISLHVHRGGLVSSLRWPTPGGLWEEELGVEWSGFLPASSREGLTQTGRGTRSLPGLNTPPAAPSASRPSAKSDPAPSKDFLRRLPQSVQISDVWGSQREALRKGSPAHVPLTGATLSGQGLLSSRDNPHGAVCHHPAHAGCAGWKAPLRGQTRPSATWRCGAHLGWVPFK